MNYIDKAFEFALELNKLDEIARFSVISDIRNKYYYRYYSDDIVILRGYHIDIDLWVEV